MRVFALAAILTIAAAPVDQLTIAGTAFPQSDILDARAIADGAGPVVLVTMTPDATKRLEVITHASLGKTATIAVGTTVLMNPVVRESITSGNIQISGLASFEEAAKLARQISGKDPLPESLEA